MLARQSRYTTRRGMSSGAAFWFGALLFGGLAVAGLMLFSNVAQRKIEAASPVLKLVDITEATVDPAEWGKNFPRQYDGYMRTSDNARSHFKWSEGRPPEDPASGKSDSKLAGDPRLKTIFNGYAFAIDYRERRGHAFMLHDQAETERVKQRPQPGACLNCHASTVVAYREAGIKAGAPGTLQEPLNSESGQKQLFAGWEHVNPMKYGDAADLVRHPVSCLDCHDPRTMTLRITRPAFLEGIADLASSTAAVPNLPSIQAYRKSGSTKPYNPNDLATRQEMRSMVCGQCHVEYHFKGDQKRLVFPWKNGLRADDIEAYYDQAGFSDWTHKDSGAKVLKAQHPEFELFNQGVHARSGVSCADCHMPYKREGAMKFSDHQVQTPLAHVNQSCQTCHNYAESEIIARVDEIQKRTKLMLDRTEIAVVELIQAIKAAKEAGASDEQLKLPRELQRRAQWRSDFINAENSLGFHAPAETLRVLGESVDYARQGINEVTKLKLAPAPATTTPTTPAPGPAPAK